MKCHFILLKSGCYKKDKRQYVLVRMSNEEKDPLYTVGGNVD
jgi:hypothetical protein